LHSIATHSNVSNLAEILTIPAQLDIHSDLWNLEKPGAFHRSRSIPSAIHSCTGSPSPARSAVHHLAVHATFQKPGHPQPMHTFSFQGFPYRLSQHETVEHVRECHDERSYH
jgi:hypothetical protein